MNETESNTGGKAQIEANAGGPLTLSMYDSNAMVRVKRPRQTPLSVNEGHATVEVIADDAVIEIELDGEQLDAVIDGLNHTQAFHREGSP